jgi:hypothetical protein
MSESIKLQPEELQALQDIQSKYQDKIYRFGQLTLERFSLEERSKQLDDLENQIKEEYIQVQKDEQQWTSGIASKYGDGNLSLKDGTFTPNQKN